MTADMPPGWHACYHAARGHGEAIATQAVAYLDYLRQQGSVEPSSVFYHEDHGMFIDCVWNTGVKEYASMQIQESICEYTLFIDGKVAVMESAPTVAELLQHVVDAKGE